MFILWRFQELIDRKGGSLYSQVYEAALEMKNKLFIYKDPGSQQFAMESLYGAVVYDRGKIHIEFNPSTEHLFYQLTSNFTKIRLDIAFKFQTNGGFQLYKLLKSEAYVLPEIDSEQSQEELPSIIMRYSLSELRMQLGYVDLNQPDIKAEGAKKNPDVEKMASLEKKPKYKRWSDFSSRVITPGVKELNRISDIYIASVDKICGARGKIDGVSFCVQLNKAFYDKNGYTPVKEEAKVVPELSADEIDDFIDELRERYNLNIRTKDYKAIAQIAGYDMNIIDVANNVYLAYSRNHDIDNVVGFFISAIRDEYDIISEKKKEPIVKNSRIHDFDERENSNSYWNEVELALLKKQNSM